MYCAGTGSAADRVCLGASAARVTISDLIPVGFNSDPVAPTGALGTVVQPASCCSRGTGRCHHLQPCVGASVLDSLGAIRGIPASWTRSAGGVACGPIRAPPAVAELLIPTTDSSVAPERRSSAMWGARKQVCINSVCHSEVLKCAELTAPHQMKVQIKK